MLSRAQIDEDLRRGSFRNSDIDTMPTRKLRIGQMVTISPPSAAWTHARCLLGNRAPP